MIGIQQTIKAFKGYKPKILTLFTNMANLRMLDDYQVYALVNPLVNEPRTFQEEKLQNVLFINTHSALEFDLCVNFSGGSWGKQIENIAKERNIDYVTYEMHYPIDVSTNIKYITRQKTSVSPGLSFGSTIKGSQKTCIPYVSPEFQSRIPVLARPIQITTYGDFMIEKHQETNFFDQNYIFNTVPSVRYGFNPQLNTHNPSIPQLAEIFTNTKIYVNTRTYGMFPVEILQAMSAGCTVVTYDFPGIEDFVSKEFICKNKEECREKISQLLANPSLMEYNSARNLEKSKEFRANQLTKTINKVWKDIHEFGYNKYRI